MGLAAPAACFLLLALATLWGAASRTWWDQRAPGVVAALNLTKHGGSQPTLEYAVDGKSYRVQSFALYSADAFRMGEQVTVLYPPQRPELGMLDRFRELWQVPIGLSVISLVLVGVAWRARTGLPPFLHAISGVALTAFGAVLGMTLFTLLCTPGGLEIFARTPVHVTLLGGLLLFFGTVPVCALGFLALWHAHVPARCPRCSGGMRGKFVGKQLTYTCAACGHRG